ncbi:30S ribosomal protein S6 [Candidatus Peregrinibacteria bacterium]|nr:30S ribosomal protein S6 [Candidatus Peregrinibacteria bacterium]
MPTLTPVTEEGRIYEFCILYPSDLTQKEESDLIKEIESIIEEVGGKQVAKDSWGKRGLAYTIGGHTEGNFIVYHYEVDPSKVRSVETALSITPKVLRHMIVKPPKGYEVVKYSEKFEMWLKEREKQEERKVREKEEALAKKVADRAKRTVKRTEVKKQEEKPAAQPTDKKKLSEELEKLISEDTLNL